MELKESITTVLDMLTDTNIAKTYLQTLARTYKVQARINNKLIKPISAKSIIIQHRNGCDEGLGLC